MDDDKKEQVLEEKMAVVEKKWKENEDKNGFLLQDFFETEVNKSYEFVSGPFTKKIFNIISLQKNKIQTTIGSIKTTIYKKDFLFRPI